MFIYIYTPTHLPTQRIIFSFSLSRTHTHRPSYAFMSLTSILKMYSNVCLRKLSSCAAIVMRRGRECYSSSARSLTMCTRRCQQGVRLLHNSSAAGARYLQLFTLASVVFDTPTVSTKRPENVGMSRNITKPQFHTNLGERRL